MSRDSGVILNGKIRPSGFLRLVIVIIIIIFYICVARLPVYVEVRESMRMLFSSVPALLMGCHPGLSRKAASSVGLGINPGIMALMPS